MSAKKVTIKTEQKVTITVEPKKVPAAPKKAPSALCAINGIARQTRKADPTLTQKEAISKASAIYRNAGAK